MNYLFDIGHPAHVHLFKNVIRALIKNGHEVVISAKKTNGIESLLIYEGFSFISLGKKGSNLVAKILKQLYFSFRIYRILRTRNIDIAMGVSISIAQAAKFTKTNAIVFDDDDISATPVFAALSHSLANYVLSPSILQAERNREKDIFHHSYHELAYLHPNYFKPDLSVLSKLGLEDGEKYSIIRFSALKAHHDINERGISKTQAEIIIEHLLHYGKVYITSEKELPANLEPYRLSLAFSEFHSFLSYANVLVCDSQSVAAEAAVLGVPSVRINTFVGRISYLEEMEKRYQLTYGYLPENFSGAIERIEAILKNEDTQIIFKERRRKLLSEKIDLSAFIIWLIENYPLSVKQIKENPEYQLKYIS